MVWNFERSNSSAGKQKDNNALGKVQLSTLRADLSCHAKLLLGKAPAKDTWSVTQGPKKDVKAQQKEVLAAGPNIRKHLKSQTAHRSISGDTEDFTTRELTMLVQQKRRPEQALYCLAVAMLVPVSKVSQSLIEGIRQDTYNRWRTLRSTQDRPKHIGAPQLPHACPGVLQAHLKGCLR